MGCWKSPFSTPDFKALLKSESNWVSDVTVMLLLALTYFLMACRLKTCQQCSWWRATPGVGDDEVGQSTTHLLPLRSLSYMARRVSIFSKKPGPCTALPISFAHLQPGSATRWAGSRASRLAQTGLTYVEDGFLDHV